MKMETSKRPETTADILEWVADHLEIVDELLKLTAQRLGKDFVPGKTVQQDLRCLAKGLEEHPEVDEMLYAYLPDPTDASD